VCLDFVVVLDFLLGLLVVFRFSEAI